MRRACFNPASSLRAGALVVVVVIVVVIVAVIVAVIVVVIVAVIEIQKMDDYDNDNDPEGSRDVRAAAPDPAYAGSLRSVDRRAWRRL